MRRGMQWAGARVLVTGAGSGIGRRLALGAAGRGAREVIVWDVSAPRAEAVCEEITRRGGRARVVTADITDRAAVAAAAAEVGPVDVVVNNAGVVSGARLLDASDETIRRTIEVNTLALFWMTRAFLPEMVARDRGVVVTVASAAGIVGVARQTDYSASKFAAVGFTESLRAELRRDGSGVRTLLVCPYYIDTGMFTGVTTRFPRLLPILREADVATRILDAVEQGRQQLVMPWLVWIVPAARLLPTRAFDALMDFFGINRTMDAFTGRSPQE